MLTIGSSFYSLSKEGLGRFSVLRDGERVGEVVGRPGSWTSYTLDSTMLATVKSHGDAIRVLAEALAVEEQSLEPA